MSIKTFIQTSFQNVRSSKRTSILHQEILTEIIDTKPEWSKYTWKFEYKLPVDGMNGTFDLDIVGFNNLELKVVILAKAMNSNINKNMKNYSNTMLGEAARIFYAPNINIEKILFVSIIPRYAPRFQTNGIVSGTDDVVSAKSRSDVKRVLDIQYNNKIQVIDIYYDINNLSSKKNKVDFNNIEVSNLDKLAMI